MQNKRHEETILVALSWFAKVFNAKCLKGKNITNQFRMMQENKIAERNRGGKIRGLPTVPIYLYLPPPFWWFKERNCGLVSSHRGIRSEDTSHNLNRTVWIFLRYRISESFWDSEKDSHPSNPILSEIVPWWVQTHMRGFCRGDVILGI